MNPMSKDLPRLLAWTIVAVVTSLAAPIASADWTEDFSGGMTHNPWVIYDDSGSNPPTPTSVRFADNNLQLIAQPQAVFDTFVVGVVGLGNEQYSFEDVTVRSTVFAPQGLNFQGSTSRGNNDTFVIVRTSADGTSGYLLALDFQSGEVDLVRSDGSDITELNASSDVPAFDPAKSYILELVAEGSNLTGRVFDGGVPVVTVSTSDTSFSSGWSGVGSAINTNENLGTTRTPVLAGFDDVSSIAITPPVNYDITGDGRVTNEDLARFVINFGKRDFSTFLEGDLDVDGRVALSDLILLRSQLVASSPATVPEPAPSILALGVVAGWRWRRRGASTQFPSLQVSK
jgi:hypothetical protein